MRRIVFVVLMIAAVLLAACGSTPEPTAAPQAATATVPTVATPEGDGDGDNGGEGLTLPEVNPLEVTGDIVTAGSSTVYPLSEAMAERFLNEGYAGNITIDSIGSGAGFERFCVQGETDIANASRPIKDSEIESCRSIGREPIEFRVGTDALAVVVSQENGFIDNATLAELALIFSTANTWADVNPAWPAEPIQRFIPGTDSGTFDYFVEAVFDENKEPMLNAAADTRCRRTSLPSAYARPRRRASTGCAERCRSTSSSTASRRSRCTGSPARRSS